MYDRFAGLLTENENGQFRHAPKELLALQDTARLHSHPCLRPTLYNYRHARGQRRACADAQW